MHLFSADRDSLGSAGTGVGTMLIDRGIFDNARTFNTLTTAASALTD